jgi:DNA-binding CsgD family transcriptional regulator
VCFSHRKRELSCVPTKLFSQGEKVNPHPIPREPRRDGMYVFRKLPTLIVAVSGPPMGKCWGIGEFIENVSNAVPIWELDCRAPWKVIYPLGVRLCRVLAGRTMREANLYGVPAADFAAALATMNERDPWWNHGQETAHDPRNGQFIAKTPCRGRGRPQLNRTITRREAEILRLICNGMRGKDIAKALAIEIRTVESHRGALYRKADVNSPAALAIWAVRKGFVSVDRDERAQNVPE